MISLSIIKMKKLFFIFLIYTHAGSCQNLIQNGGFEDYFACPDVQPSFPINFINHWYSPNKNTPDYFNTCSDPLIQVPSNYFGFQHAQEGNGYSGGQVFGLGDPNREYITNRLETALLKDTLYCLKFYISLSGKNTYKTAIDRMQIYFSADSVWYDTFFTLPVTPQLETEPGVFLQDTVNWMEISLPYVASGGERYMTIGNFRENIDTDTIKLTTVGGNKAYYYFDNFSLEECNPIPPPKEIVILNVFTPNKDGYNDLFKIVNLPENSQLTVYNRWGNIVYSSVNYQNDWDGAGLSDGVYYYILNIPDGNSKKGAITILR